MSNPLVAFLFSVVQSCIVALDGPPLRAVQYPGIHRLLISWPGTDAGLRRLSSTFYSRTGGVGTNRVVRRSLLPGQPALA